jgi:CRISPR system Cascade subunit CasD
MRLGIRPQSLLEALAAIEWQASPWARDRVGSGVSLEVILDDAAGDREVDDAVRSFDPVSRSYGSRRTRHHYVEVSNPQNPAMTADLDHDPISLLEG